MEKSVLRAEIRARRRSAAGPAVEQGPGPADGACLARVALDWLAGMGGGDHGAGHGEGGGRVVCAYVSTGHEPPTMELLAACHEAGYAVHVPVCEAGFQLSWVRWHPGVALVKSSLAPVMEPLGPRLPFDALEPAGGADSGESRVLAIIVPALAVDGSGVRLGQGGGYYDRFLVGAAGTPLAAVVYDHECLPAGTLPHDGLDMPVDFALTPSAWIPLGTRPAGAGG